MKIFTSILTLLCIAVVDCNADEARQSVESLSKSLEAHVRTQRTFLGTASQEEKRQYFSNLLPTEQEFKILFGVTGEAWRAWKAEPGLNQLVELYGDGGRSAKISVSSLERDPSWYHGRIAVLVKGRLVFRADVQAELNLKPHMYATYAFVNNRWVFIQPPLKTLELTEGDKKKQEAHKS